MKGLIGKVGSLLSALAVIGLSGLVWVTMARAEGTLDKAKRSGVLFVGVSEEAPPFGFRDPESGQLVGYDVDFVTALADRLGVKLRLRPVTEADRLSALLDGTVDVLAAELTETEARSAIVAFSDPYVVSGQKVIARRGTIRTLEDLAGKRIGAVVGTFAEACTKDRCTVSHVVPFDDYITGIEALQNGKIDAFTADESILVDLFAGLPADQYEIPDVLIVREEYRLAVRKGDGEFLDFLNQTVRALQENGDTARLRRKWFTPQAEAAPPAYGSIVRKATTRPRFLGVILNGTLYPGAEVTLFGVRGEELGKGRISSVFGDEFYVDVAENEYDLVQPGTLVAMNMNAQMAMDVLMRRRGVLETVRSDAEKAATEVRKEFNEEAEAKRKRAVEMDTFRQRLEETTQSDRSRYFRFYYRRRFR